MTDALQILVIDDSVDDRMLYTRTLSKNTEGRYWVIEAEDGEAGLAILEKDVPDCVLLDYSMPGRDGIEILRQIRARFHFLPVVMLTGQGNESVAVNAMREGAQNYIAKSTITPETLDLAIRMATAHALMEQRIEEQRTSLEIFAHALAHDLKEPIRTIHAYLQMIDRREKFEGKSHDYFTYVTKAAKRMNALIETVHYYTRLNTIDQNPREASDLTLLLEEVLNTLAPLIQERQAVITADTLPVLVANSTQLAQLFQNLIVNAIHYTPDSPHIHFSAEEKTEYWILRVTDNGPGVEPEYRDKIFEPFKRMSLEHDRGLGLGLAICKRILEVHGGRIEYEEKSGCGATFRLIFPKKVAIEAKKIA